MPLTTPHRCTCDSSCDGLPTYSLRTPYVLPTHSLRTPYVSLRPPHVRAAHRRAAGGLHHVLARDDPRQPEVGHLDRRVLIGRRVPAGRQATRWGGGACAARSGDMALPPQSARAVGGEAVRCAGGEAHRMFSGFRSRCTIFFSCMYLSASHSCMMTPAASFSV